MSESPVTRGRFLRALGAAGTAAVGLSIAATPRHLAAIVSGKATLKKVANLKAVKAGVNGPYTFSVEGTDPNTHEIFLVRAGSKVTALEGTCRHKGCPIAWVAGDKKFECPCHGSQYSMTGKVVQGPATADLYKHAVTVKAGQVWVMTTRVAK